MGRCTLLKAGNEHPYPICDGWKKLCRDKQISYEYFVCGCSSCERTYQMLMKDGSWENIYNCPFCSVSINKWSWNYTITSSDKPYTLIDRVNDLEIKVSELEREIYGSKC